MSAGYHNKARFRLRTPIVRSCMLCGQQKMIRAMTEEHRKAHVTRQIAFVCEECATRVRMEVEQAAGGATRHPRVSA